jgi:tRNA 2-thiocytidine biosynthesis protein TtcA
VGDDWAEHAIRLPSPLPAGPPVLRFDVPAWRPINLLEGSTDVRDLGVDWVLREDQPTLRLVARGVDHGCDVCSRHRRSALYRTASRLGCTVLALGHTADDCAEALLRNILFNGRIASLPPVARSRNGGMRVIRPLVLVGED